MKPHELRVVDEKKELDTKREKLKEFFGTGTYDNLPEQEKLLLVKQLNAMTTYADVLQQRIHLFEDDELGELDPSKACSTSGESCESCS